MTGETLDHDSTASPRIDVTVVLTAHAEGRLAHRSLRSAQRAIRFAQAQGVHCEIIAVLDCASHETLTYFRQRSHDLNKVSEVAFGDPGLSRNHGVELASGRYIAFLDADDLFSQNWLASAFKFFVASGEKSLVLHPEVTIAFGMRHFVWFHMESVDAAFSAFDMIEANFWSVSCLVERDFFLNGNRHASTDLHGGFGHEDWHWNCEVMAKGGKHLIVPRTAQFIRMKADGSQCARAEAMRAVFRKTELFDQAATSASLDNSRELPVEASPASKLKFASGRFLELAYRRVRSFALNSVFRDARLRGFCVAVLNAAKKSVTSPSLAPSLPEWLIDEWKLINRVEPELFPTEQLIRSIDRYNPAGSRAGRLYPVLDSLVGSSPTHVFLVPLIDRGITDLGAIQQMTAVAHEDANSRVVCIATEASDSLWHGRLPEAITFVDFGKLTASFTEAERATLLLRLLVQKSPQVIHETQSPLGQHLFSKYGRALSSQSNLFTSAFYADPPPDGHPGGFAPAELPHYIDHLTKVFSGNQQLVDWLCDTYAFEKERFATIYYPALTVARTPSNKQGDNSLHILWVGAMNEQNRPDVVVQVATNLAGLPVHFHLHGGSQPDTSGRIHLQELRGMANVTIHGQYSDPEGAGITNYDLLLYTSQRNGLPSILLEAAATELPIIAPDVSGIKEFIDDETGFLVSHAEAVDEYVTCVKAILRDRRIVVPKVAAAKALLETKHSWASFVGELRKVPCYFTELGAHDPVLLGEVVSSP